MGNLANVASGGNLCYGCIFGKPLHLTLVGLHLSESLVRYGILGTSASLENRQVGKPKAEIGQDGTRNNSENSTMAGKMKKLKRHHNPKCQ